MIDRSWPGAWYCDVAIDGRWAVLLPEGPIWPDVAPQVGRVITDAGELPLPPGGNPLFLRLGPGRHLCGSGHQDDLVYEWDGIAWTARAPSVGNHAGIFDWGGNLHVSEMPPMGARYATPTGIVGCEQTYADQVRQVWEYTELGDLTIGQGGAWSTAHGEDCLVALYQRHRYRLQDGRCRFINAYRDGDQIALAWVQEDTREARLRWLSIAEIQQYPEEPWPVPDAPTVRLTAAPTSGPVPLVVTGQVTLTDATTWRWLKDHIIDPPYDGQTHTYRFTTTGSHTVAVRAAGPGGTTTTPDAVILATTSAPRRTGLQMGFREPLGQGRYAQVRALGWDLARLDVMTLTRDEIAVCVSEAQAEGFRVLALISADQIPACPDGIDVEVYADTADPTDIGTEPDIRQPPLDQHVIADAIHAQMPTARAKGLTVWAGCISNLSPHGLSWLEGLVPLLDPDVCVTAHRYPPKLQSAWADPRPGMASRQAEVDWLKRIAAGRPWAISEGGWATGTYRYWWFWTRTVTQATQAANEARERAWWRAQGADYYVKYQINDGPEATAGGPGIFDYRGQAKLAAVVAPSTG